MTPTPRAWPGAISPGADIVMVEGVQDGADPQDRGLPPRSGARPALPARPAQRRRLGGDRHRRREAAGRLPSPPVPRHDVAPSARQPGLGSRQATELMTGLSAREAALRILQEVRRQPPLRVPLDDALDAVLAEDSHQPPRHPRLDQLRDGRLRRPRRRRAGRQHGRPRAAQGRSSSSRREPSPPAPIGPGECARIFTGAPLPEGTRQRHPPGGHRPGRALSSRS